MKSTAILTALVLASMGALAACGSTPQVKVTVTETVEVAPAPTFSYSEPSEPQGKCDPNYAGGCVPIVSYDLDCGDIRMMVEVVGVDIHGFDRDKDRWGCESYG